MSANLGAPVQIAYAVADVRVAAHRWAQTHGAGPFVVIDHIPLARARYRGAAASFDHSSAYGQWGSVMVELVCDHTIGPSPIADVVGPGGSGLHHVAHFVDDLSQAQSVMVENGWPEALYAETATGTAFAFHDATAELGHMVELYVGTPGLRAFYDAVAQLAVGWDGADVIRSRP